MLRLRYVRVTLQAEARYEANVSAMDNLFDEAMRIKNKKLEKEENVEIGET